ncbi:CHASE domain-containing protein [Paractinoplanes lichenicola]|uniref:CHASE domain-containing protein n=1 Tax=Paractinoplanes lichenicola TaxID=2802976 RepID=A0ABS1W2T2_9ACTN|nr:CHASE domain-containing protein [Actinoplanes lichenicola]MBL7261051.1 CHASE domain-containing protein [Actinoplanes lichenicola]
MSPFDDRDPVDIPHQDAETPLHDLMTQVIDLADEAVTARLTDDELLRQLDLIEREVDAEPSATGRNRVLHRRVGAKAWARRAAAATKKVASARSRSLALVAVVLLGLVGTGLSVAGLRRADHIRANQVTSEKADLAEQAFQAALTQYTDSLNSLAVALSVQPELDASTFETLTSPAWSSSSAASGVHYVVAANSAQIPQVQSEWRDRGATGLTLEPTKTSDEHFVVVLTAALGGGTSSGLDLSASPQAAEALRQSRDTGVMAASSPSFLLRDASIPAEERQQALVLAAPVFTQSAGKPGGNLFRGWVVTGLRLDDLLRQGGRGGGGSFTVRLRDITVKAAPRMVASYEWPGTEEASAARMVNFTAGQRQWQLELTPIEELRTPSDHLEVAAWMIGSFITLLLLALVAAATRSADPSRGSDGATTVGRERPARREEPPAKLETVAPEPTGPARVLATRNTS